MQQETKPDIDIIILSDSKTDYHRTITETSLETLLKSESEIKVNPIVVESNPEVNYFDQIKALHFTSKFNYNAYMNEAAHSGSAPYIAFCNNDLEYEPEWATRIISAMQSHNLDSASPFCRHTHGMNRLHPTGAIRLGWTVRMEFAGWCFVMKRESWKKIGGLDEDFSFWCADNAVVEQMKRANMKHALVTNSVVNHIGGGGQTLNTLDPATKEQYTFVQVKKFNKKYGQNVWGLGQ